MGKNKRQFLLSHQNQDQNKTSIGGGGLTVFYPRIGKNRFNSDLELHKWLLFMPIY